MKSHLRYIKEGILDCIGFNYQIIYATLIGILVMEFTLVFAIASDTLWPLAASELTLFVSFVLATFCVFWILKFIYSRIRNQDEEEINGFH